MRKVIDNERLKGKHFAEDLTFTRMAKPGCWSSSVRTRRKKPIEKGRKAQSWAQKHDRAQIGHAFARKP